MSPVVLCRYKNCRCFYLNGRKHCGECSRETVRGGSDRLQKVCNEQLCGFHLLTHVIGVIKERNVGWRIINASNLQKVQTLTVFLKW